MMTNLEESLHTFTIRKNLRKAHIINKSHVAPRTSYIGKRISNAVALRKWPQSLTHLLISCTLTA